MTRKRWMIAAIALVVVIGGVVLWRARSAPRAPKYRTAAIERGNIVAVVSATGTLQPVVQVEVGSQVSGTVYRIHADFNSRVRKGQVLCEIEPSALRARVVQAQAAVVKADVSVKDARRVLARAQELAKQNYVSQAEVEAKEVQLEQGQADLRQARAQLQVNQVDLTNSVIRAPIDGVVIARSIDLGQTVAASLQAPKLFVIANDMAQMQVETRIDEADIGRIRPGLPVSFTVDAYPDAEFDGEVAQVRLEPIVEQGVVTYTTVIRTGNPGLRLKPGMTANVSVEVARRDDVLKAPTAALRFRPATEGRSGAGSVRADAAGSSSDRGGQGRAFAGVPAGADSAGATRGGATGRRGGGRGRGGAGSAPRAMAPPDETGVSESALKPGSVYVLARGKPDRVPVMTGLSDGTSTEIVSDKLAPGAQVVIGAEATARGTNTQLPPGMGGPFGGGGGGRGGGGRRP